MVETDLGAGSKDEDVETRGEEKKLVVRYEYVGLSEICGDNVLSRRVRISLSQKLMVLLEPQVEKAPRNKVEHSIVHNVHEIAVGGSRSY